MPRLAKRAARAALAPWVIAGAAAVLGGCATAAIETAQAAKSEVIIQANLEEAGAGDAEAQYKVGKAFCCSLHEGSGLYNTERAVHWLCESARQDYTPAMYELGKIYSGDTVDGIRLARRLAAGVAGSSTNLPVAAAWLQFAKDRGDAEAADMLPDLWSDMSEDDLAAARSIVERGMSEAPCRWGDVIGG